MERPRYLFAVSRSPDRDTLPAEGLQKHRVNPVHSAQKPPFPFPNPPACAILHTQQIEVGVDAGCTIQS